MTDKSCWWGPLPWEQDGGAIVNYYLLEMLNYLNPRHEFHGIPKMAHQLDASELPFMTYMVPEMKGGLAQGNKHLFRQIPYYLAKNEIPLFVMFHLPWEFFPMANAIKAQMGAKTIIHQTVHWKTDVLFQSPVLKDIDAWVAPTRWAKKQLATIGKISSKRIKYLPHAVNCQKFYPHESVYRKKLDLRGDQKVILLTGRCSLAKGWHQVIPVLRPIIRDYNAVFIIRGGIFKGVDKGAEIGYIIKTMAQNHPKNIKFFPNWLPPPLMEDLVATGDILLQPSGHEGFDVPLIEAFATKQAIAVTNIPNHWEIMGQRNRYCGVMMEPSVAGEKVNKDGCQRVLVPSSDMIEGTLRFLLDNPDECKAMGENGYARVRRNYNLQTVAHNWLDYMHHLIPDGFQLKGAKINV